MAFFYIHASGTAGATTDDGRFTSLQTGAFTNGTSYATFDDALNGGKANPPVDGDWFIWPDTYSVEDTTPYGSLAIDCTMVSVDVNNRETYKKGAEYTANAAGGTDMNINTGNGTVVHFYGIELNGADQIRGPDNGSNWVFHDCKITMNSWINYAEHNTSITFIDTEFVMEGSGSGFNMDSQATKLILDNCTNSGVATNDIVTQVTDRFKSVEIRNMDLSGFLAASGSIFQDAIPAGYHVDVSVHRCSLPTGFTVFGSTISEKTFATVTECGGINDDSYYYSFYQNAEGEAETDTTTHRSTATYDDATGYYSINGTSTSLATPERPFRFYLGTLAGVDLATADQTITVEIDSATASLTDADIWIECVRNDQTKQSLGVKEDGNKPTSILTAGSALAAGSGTWTSGGGNKYVITEALASLTTDPANANVDVFVYMGKASLDANFDLPTIANT